MAELLIKAINFTHPDTDTDKAGSYKRGDVVVICPDNCPWGAQEAKAPANGGVFCIVKVSGESVVSLSHFEKPETVQVFNTVLNDNVDDLITCREWRLNISELDAGVIAALDSPGLASIPLATFLAAMERKIDGVRGDAI